MTLKASIFQRAHKLIPRLGLAFVLLLAGQLFAASPSTTQTPVTTSASLNVEAATRAYLDRLTPEQKQRSDAYFEGGYWLQLWDFLLGTVVALVLLQSRLSAWMRDVAGRVTRRKAVHTVVYWIQYVLVTSLLMFPLTLYAGFFREHSYGMSNQSFSAWVGDLLKERLLIIILGSIALVPILALVRRRSARWHIYSSSVAILFLAFVLVITPVFINPVFNKYTPLNDAKVRDPILRLARANGIPVEQVFEMDASRQTKRISANVSGAFGTTRVTLNDNLLNKCTLPEIEAVMGHEMGHYVLNHIYKMLLFFGALIVVMMALLRWSLDGLIARWGPRWEINGRDDLAALPLTFALIAAMAFVATPLLNTFIRTQEIEADLFGLNASRQPEGFAEVALKLSEYRKMEPGPVEEFIFYDHPSGATRIRMAMRWKAEQIGAASGASPP